jgi:hypothetical protein
MVGIKMIDMHKERFVLMQSLSKRTVAHMIDQKISADVIVEEFADDLRATVTMTFAATDAQTTYTDVAAYPNSLRAALACLIHQFGFHRIADKVCAIFWERVPCRITNVYPNITVPPDRENWKIVRSSGFPPATAFGEVAVHTRCGCIAVWERERNLYSCTKCGAVQLKELHKC